MKKVIGVLFSMCIVMAFMVAGTIIDANPLVSGAIGLVVTSIPSFASNVNFAFALSLSKDLRSKQNGLIEELKPLANKKASEFTDEERKMWGDKHTELSAVNEELRVTLEQEEVLKSQAAINGRDLSDQDKKDIARYSFRNAILAKAEGRELTGVELEMHQEAHKEATAEGRSISGVGVPYLLLSQKPLSRASTGQNIATAGDGGYLKQEAPLLFLAALRNQMAITGMGAKFITGLVGDFPIVTGSLFTASWLAEDATDTTTKIAFTKATMQPKRVQATGALSLKLLKQSSPDVEALIESELIDAIAQALQVAAINGGGTDAPLGILGVSGIGDVAGGTNGLAPAWSHIVDLESKIMIANADGPSLAYLTNAKVRGKLKQVDKASGAAQFVWDKDGMNGYKAHTTNAVPSTLTKGSSGAVCSAILFADWSKLFIGQWGGLDVIVDPYSLKKKAEVEVTAISYYDICATYPAAFAAMKDALTT
jgi:HK97 family phage major capsid protein